MPPLRLGPAILAAASASPALAQTAPPPSVRVACAGSIAATGGPTSFVVEQPGAVWLRLHFASVELPRGRERAANPRLSREPSGVPMES